MKKSIFALFCGLVCLFAVSCTKGINDVDPATLDNTINKCWAITYTYSGISATDYVWCTERECVETLQMSQKLVSVGKYTYKHIVAAGDADACYKLSEDLQRE